jgi:hypothetical protein
LAHYKRKRPRTSGGGYYSRNGLKNRLGEQHDEWLWLHNWPRHWDKTFHTKPHRAAARALERKVMKGFDPDDMAWPLAKKPHIYYW